MCVSRGGDEKGERLGMKSIVAFGISPVALGLLFFYAGAPLFFSNFFSPISFCVFLGFFSAFVLLQQLKLNQL